MQKCTAITLRGLCRIYTQNEMQKCNSRVLLFFALVFDAQKRLQITFFRHRWCWGTRYGMGWLKKCILCLADAYHSFFVCNHCSCNFFSLSLHVSGNRVMLHSNNEMKKKILFIGVWGNSQCNSGRPYTLFYHHRRLLYHALSFAFDIKGLFHAIHNRHTVLKMRPFYVNTKAENEVEVRKFF